LIYIDIYIYFIPNYCVTENTERKRVDKE